MIGLRLAIKSIIRQPWRHLIGILGVVSVLIPLMLMWSMKVGFMTSLIDALRSAPSNLELRLRGDYLLDADKIDRVKSLKGVGFVVPTARMLATRAFASLEDGARRTPVSLMPTGDGDPLTAGTTGAVGADSAMISSGLAERLGVRVGDTMEVSNQRRDQAETLRVVLKISGIVRGEGVGGQWVFVDPHMVQAVEAFIDGYEVPEFNVSGKPASDRPAVYSGLRIYADRIENVASVAKGLQRMDFVVESNAGRIENVLQLDKTLNAIVFVMGIILLAGLGFSVWAALAAILEQLKRHLALLGLMGAQSISIGFYFVAIGLFIAVAGTSLAALGVYGLMELGNQWMSHLAGPTGVIFRLPLVDASLIAGLVLVLQTIITVFIAARAAIIHPREMLRDE